MNHPIRFLLFLLSLILSAAHAQDTALTYQGELRQSGTPAHGPFDFEVALHVAETGGSPVDVVALDNVVVDRGRFALALDFTEVPFESGPTWMEIRVRPGSQTGGYTTLSPRQRVAPVPYAITAQGVAESAIDARAIDDDQVQRRVTGSCPPGSTLVGIQADGALDCEPLPISLSVPLDEVGPEHARTSIAVRPDGRPVISYYDSINRDLKLYDCHDSACITGIARTLDSGGDVGRGSSVAIRDDGTPIIAYVGANADLGIFACDNTSCSGLFPGANSLFSTGGVSDLDIAIRNDGRPVISYMDPDVMVWVCSFAECGSGTPQLIDTQEFTPNGPIRGQTAVVIDQNGLPAIGYGAGAAGASIYQCDTASCGSGQRFPLDTSEISASNVDLAIGPEGERLISHTDGRNDNLELLACAAEGCMLTFSGRTFARVTLVGGTVSTRTSIAVRPDGSAVISFIDRLRDRLMVYSCGSANCGQ